MRAITLTSYGDPDVLQIEEIPDPEIGPEDVLVDVVATAVNRADLLQRRGLYPEPGPARPHEVPGMEFSGRVARLGSRVQDWSIGQEVMGIVSGGAYAERVAIHERQAMVVPEAVGVADAAAIPEVWITAYDALVVQGGLTAGQWALVHAGASGVGTAAIQIAKHVGASVITTSSAAKVDACRDLGADVAVDYTGADFVPRTKEATSGFGADVVLDVVGGDYLARNVDALAQGGTIVQVGVMGGGSATFPLGALLPKRAHLVGTVLRARPLEEKVAISRRFAREVLPGFERGDLHPVIDCRFPLEAVAEAHRHVEANANVGKVLLDVVSG